MQALMVVSVPTSEVGDGGLSGLCGPHEGRQAFLPVQEALRELHQAVAQGQQGWVRGEGRESGMGWS